MKREYLLLILFLAVLAVAAAWSIPLGTVEESLPMTVNVTGIAGREIGFAVAGQEEKELDFGATFPGTTVIKTMNLTRGNQPPAFVSISPEGSIASWVAVSDPEFLLVQPRQVKVNLKIPEDAREGIYKGLMRITYKKTLFSTMVG